MKTFGTIFLSLALLALFDVVCYGTPTPLQGQDTRPNREEVEGMMEAYILSKLQDALELTDEDYGRMVVAQKKLQDTRREYRRERGRVLRQMRQALGRDQASEEDLLQLLGELDRIRDEFVENEKTRYTAIDEILDARQRAQYRILETEIQRRLQQLLRQVRGQRNEPRRPFQ